MDSTVEEQPILVDKDTCNEIISGDSCEPCSMSNIREIATHHCEDCNERYCEGCSISHRASKSTKKHKLVDLNMTTPSHQCEPCSTRNKIISATSICGDCEEFLCDTCKIQHLSQRQNKSHKVVPVPDLLCEPCRSVDKKAEAVSFCNECEEPEALCQSCADHHKSMKKTKHHQLSSDMSAFILRYKIKDNTEERDKTLGKEDLSGEEKPLCQPCSCRNLTVPASHYCKNCEEMYCTNCASQHKNMKAFAKDEIVELKDVLTTHIYCEPCKYSNEEVKATNKCDQCDEFLCDKCKTTHLSLKKTRNHIIRPISTGFKCENCPEIDATFYCKECDGPVCEECAEQHKVMKKTRSHTLSKDLTACIIAAKVSAVTIECTDDKPIEKGVSASSQPKYQGAQVLSDDVAKHQCVPCKFGDKEVVAVSFCKDCEEELCEECMVFHKAEIEYQGHTITDISAPKIFCTTCKSSNKDVQAKFFCKDCEDKSPYCETCAKKHSAMKKTRGHRLSEDLSLIQSSFHQTELLKREQPQSNTPDKAEIKKEKHAEIGKPYSEESKSDCIVLHWRSDKKLGENETYKIIFKEHPNGKWRPYVTDMHLKQARIVVNGLKAETPYIFKLRIVDDITASEGPFTEESDPIFTRRSPAQGILKDAEKIDHGPPGVYRLPIKENISARNESAKTRKFTLGTEGIDTTERTLMIVGATGCGKSTLINGMANYLMGVNWEDRFRFTIINLETVEKERENNQALSQTEWVTCYTLHNDVTDRVDYTVNVIDTPGFGDTRGLEQDSKIVEQIRQLFTEKGEKGVATLDAVCFILKAPDARLTAAQRYIFESILALFGNDIKDNICTLITFADGQKPPVLSGIEAMDGCPLPFKTYFTFNNSALYVNNTDDTPNNLSSFFWDMGTKSYRAFFHHLSKLETRSLSLTSEVLRKRYKLENTIVNLQKEIDVGLSQINLLEKEAELFSRNAEAILANKDFEYEVEEPILEQVDLSGTGQYTTTCLTCNYTCHESCAFADDNDKARCCAMNSAGNCTECPKGCHWKQHKNAPYILKWSKRKVKKRYDEMKKKYEEATQKTLTQEQVIEEMHQDIVHKEQEIQVMMELINKLNNRLKEIALRPDPLSMTQYIDLMIASEEREKKSGFEGRIDALHKCKRRAMYGEQVQVFQDRIKSTRKKMAASDVADEMLKKEETSGGKLQAIKTFLFGSKK